MKILLAPLFGKYRDLVLFIGIFLLIDAGVSAINIYTSRQIEADAGRINTAGLLRTYSQQLTKALLTLDKDLRSEALTQSSLAEISEARLGFEEARKALESQLAEAPTLAFIEPESMRQQTQDKLKQVIHTWEPIDREVGPLLLNADLDLSATETAVQKAVTRDNRLTQQASDLSDSLEELARQKTATVRIIQAGAITLAFINFVFILIKFIGKLSASDRKAAEAREETERILGSVSEGLFLLTSQRTVGQQRSASLDRIFGQQLQPGADFNDFLERLTSPENATAARDYIDLLFVPKMKQSLLLQLNPLQDIELLAEQRTKKSPTHLSFEFNQVREGDEIVALLVTVFDVSQKVQLTHELAGAKARADNEISLLLGVLDHNPKEVAAFLQRARDALQQINGELQGVQPVRLSYPQLINRIARLIHGLKGEAATLGCTSISLEAHAFEEHLQPLRGRNNIGGDELIPIAVALSSLLSEIIKVETVVMRVKHFASGREQDEASIDPLTENLQRIEQYAQKVAGELGKQIRFESEAPRFVDLPLPLTNILRTAVPQLIRNAIVHGIESPGERKEKGKLETGLIRLQLNKEANGELTLSVEDDGRGISAEHLRRTLASRGLMPADKLATLSDEDVIATIFEPGFSSLDLADQHAGRGDGLAVVKDQLRQLGGRLRVHSRPDVYTRFILQFKIA